jgi:hypothetical protein
VTALPALLVADGEGGPTGGLDRLRCGPQLVEALRLLEAELGEDLLVV